MTEQIKSAIEELELTSNFFPNDWTIALAIRSLHAWEEVIEELEKLKSISNGMLDFDGEDMYFVGKKQAYKDAIEIINQHLSEIEK